MITFWAGPQEGTWTPTSAIIEVNDGEEYGLGGKGISPPLCYVPRGIDNSTGGMKEITSDKWGPFKGSHVGLSYGSGTHLPNPSGRHQYPAHRVQWFH